MRLIFLTLLFTASIMAQATPHSVTLTWNDDFNPQNTTYNIFHAVGSCLDNPIFIKLNTSPITTKTYDHLNVEPGLHCYAATAVYEAIETKYSDFALAEIPPSSGKIITIEIKDRIFDK